MHLVPVTISIIWLIIKRKYLKQYVAITRIIVSIILANYCAQLYLWSREINKYLNDTDNEENKIFVLAISTSILMVVISMLVSLLEPTYIGRSCCAIFV